VNLALRQPTWQSSTHQTFTSDKAVDGNKNTVFYDGYCSATDIDASPWMAVDLGKLTDVYGAAVTNRKDLES
jgi:F5/8 type C domain